MIMKILVIRTAKEAHIHMVQESVITRFITVTIRVSDFSVTGATGALMFKVLQNLFVSLFSGKVPQTSKLVLN